MPTPAHLKAKLDAAKASVPQTKPVPYTPMPPNTVPTPGGNVVIPGTTPSKPGYTGATAGGGVAINSPIVNPPTGTTTAPPPAAYTGARYDINGTQIGDSNPNAQYYKTQAEAAAAKAAQDAANKPGGVTTPLTPGKLVEGGYQNIVDAAGNPIFGGKINMPATEKAMMDQHFQEQERQKQYLANQSAKANQVQSSELEMAKTAAESQKAAIDANYAVGREGVMSSSKPMAGMNYKSIISQGMTNAQTRYDSAVAERDNMAANLANAQQSENYELAAQYAGKLANAELKIQQSQANLLSTAESYGKFVLDTQTTMQDNARKNADAVSGIFELGMEMTVPQLLSVSKQYNVPMEAVSALYTGMDQIRNMKGIEEGQKKALMQQEQQKFKDLVDGKTTELSKNLSYALKMKSAGLMSESQYTEYLRGAGISDDQDPDRKYKLAQIALANSGTQENLAQAAKARSELIAAGGTASVILPGKEGAYPVAESVNGVYIDTGDDTKLRNGWCGEFVNDVMGTKFADNYGDKLKYAQDSLKRVSATPGAVFLIPDTPNNPYGHVGVIESMNPDGTFNVVDQNGTGDRTIKHRNNVALNNASFWMPPGGQVSGGTQGEMVDSAVTAIMSPFSSAKPSDWPEKQRGAIQIALGKKKQEYLANGDILNFVKASAGGTSPTESERTALKQALTSKDQLDEIEKNISKMTTGPFIGRLRKLNGYDDQAKLVIAQLQGITPNIARGIYGERGVLTDQDVKNYIQTLPNLTNTESQNKLLIALTSKIIQRSMLNELESSARSGVDVSGWASYVENLQKKEQEAASDLEVVPPKGTPTHAQGGVDFWKGFLGDFVPKGQQKKPSSIDDYLSNQNL